ncbi:hypothetical protein RSAG8_02195, partial [Rhizoctonia solani AG-8 WAC10335]
MGTTAISRPLEIPGISRISRLLSLFHLAIRSVLILSPPPPLAFWHVTHESYAVFVPTVSRRRAAAMAIDRRPWIRAKFHEFNFELFFVANE